MRNSALGVILKLISTVVFSVMYVVIKLAGPVPVGEVVFFRALFALVPLFVLAAFTGGIRGMLYTARPLSHITRAAIGVSSMACNFLALKMLPLAAFTALGFTAPVFVLIFAILFLGERVGRYRAGAVLVAFFGVALMLGSKGGFDAALSAGMSTTGSVLALVSAVLTAAIIIFIRQMSATEKSETIVLYYMTVCSVVGALSMIWDRTALSPASTAWLVLCGILGGIGQITMTVSYRYSEPSLLAPLDYLMMIWAVLLGYLVFGEVPERMVMIGAAIVLGSGLLIAWREHVLGKRIEARSLAIGAGPATAVATIAEAAAKPTLPANKKTC